MSCKPDQQKFIEPGALRLLGGALVQGPSPVAVVLLALRLQVALNQQTDMPARQKPAPTL